MKEIPEDIKQKIEETFPEETEAYLSRQIGAYFGYSLSQEQLGAKEKEIDDCWFKISFCEKKINVMDEMLQGKDKEIERLKGLLEKLVKDDNMKE